MKCGYHHSFRRPRGLRPSEAFYLSHDDCAQSINAMCGSIFFVKNVCKYKLTSKLLPGSGNYHQKHTPVSKMEDFKKHFSEYAASYIGMDIIQPKDNNPPFPFLDLPNAVLFRFLELLPDHLRCLFAQLCRDLRLFMMRFKRRLFILPSSLEELDFIRHLNLVSRDAPNKWACMACRTLHENDPEDVPSEHGPACLNNFHYYYHLQGETRYMLQRHHVVMALKYARQPTLTRVQSRHLHDLMAPYFRTLFHGTWEASLYPVIRRGRFLLMIELYSDLESLYVGKFMCWSDLPAQLVCCHQVPPPEEGYIYEHHHVCMTLYSVLMGIGMVSGRSLHQCSLCSAEFGVERTESTVSVNIWKDLGPETSEDHDLSWDGLDMN